MIRLRRGIVVALGAARPGAHELEVDVDGTRATAISYPELSGPVTVGDTVILNTTAVALGLGTGGVHFVVAVEGADGEDGADGADGQRPGQVMKARYTPVQTAAAAAASLYVGYYASQQEGKSIHSPKNCLPGAGWDVLASRSAQVALATGGTITVNRYVLQKHQQRALVLYWYEGRGRVEASEYAVRWQLLKDTALRRRSDEALVRIIVPITTTAADAFRVGSELAARIAPAVRAALPA